MTKLTAIVVILLLKLVSNLSLNDVRLVNCLVDTCNTSHSVDYVCRSSFWLAYWNDHCVYKRHGKFHICVDILKGKNGNCVVSRFVYFRWQLALHF